MNQLRELSVRGTNDRPLSRYNIKKEYTGQTVFSHLIRIRTEDACRLLQETDMSVSDCAIRCGFDNPGYSSRKFKQLTGTTPKAFRSSSEKNF